MKKGFTLIELLAVIVILGILLIIAIPSINTILKKSKIKSFVYDANAYIKAAKYETINSDKNFNFFNIDDLDMENSHKSPYGFDYNGAVLAYDENNSGNYKYYIYLYDNGNNSIGTCFSNQLGFVREDELNTITSLNPILADHCSMQNNISLKVKAEEEEKTPIIAAIKTTGGETPIEITKENEINKLKEKGTIVYLKTVDNTKVFEFVVISDNGDTLLLYEKHEQLAPSRMVAFNSINSSKTATSLPQMKNKFCYTNTVRLLTLNDIYNYLTINDIKKINGNEKFKELFDGFDSNGQYKFWISNEGDGTETCSMDASNVSPKYMKIEEDTNACRYVGITEAEPGVSFGVGSISEKNYTKFVVEVDREYLCDDSKCENIVMDGSMCEE